MYDAVEHYCCSYRSAAPAADMEDAFLAAFDGLDDEEKK
jgi:hypothetical protein